MQKDASHEALRGISCAAVYPESYGKDNLDQTLPVSGEKFPQLLWNKDALQTLLKSHFSGKAVEEQPYLPAEVEDSVLDNAIEKPQKVEQDDKDTHAGEDDAGIAPYAPQHHTCTQQEGR